MFALDDVPDRCRASTDGFLYPVRTASQTGLVHVPDEVAFALSDADRRQWIVQRLNDLATRWSYAVVAGRLQCVTGFRVADHRRSRAEAQTRARLT